MKDLRIYLAAALLKCIPILLQLQLVCIVFVVVVIPDPGVTWELQLPADQLRVD